MDLPPKHNHITLFVCLACQRSCPECSQRGLMSWKPNYQMSIEEVTDFIKYTKESNYPQFKSIIVSGGEPLLWKNLEEGTRLLKESGLAKAINVFSNGMNGERISNELLSNINMIRISRYKDNGEILDDLFRRFGSQKIIIVNRTEHTPIPKNFLDNVLPATCGCEGFGVCDRVVYGCPMVPAVIKEFDIPMEIYPETYTDLKPHWMEYFEGFARENYQLCRGCIGNLKVRKIMGAGK